MRLHRFYIEEKVGDQAKVIIHDPSLISQVRHVFRLKTGDGVIVFDGSGFDFTCAIESFERDSITLVVNEKSNSRSMTTGIILCVAVIKKDKFEWVVEKATELGVTKIIPILAERSEKKSLNMERLKKIAIEASEQSGRGDVPVIDPIVELEKVTELVNVGSMQAPKIVFHTEGESLQRSDLYKEGAPPVIFIGPEGGWSPSEIELFHKSNIPIRCLGSQILRTETAVVAVLSQATFYCFSKN